MRDLYRRAKQNQWDGERALDWSTDVDPLNPERALMPYEFFASERMREHGVRMDRGSREDLAFRHDLSSWMLSQFLHGEQGALQAAAQVTESVQWLENHLKDYAGAVLMITHDRYFLDNVVGWILELDRGRGIPYEGNYSAWLEQKAKRLEQEAREDKAKHKTLERELEWIRAGAKARQAKQKARINAYNELASQSEREKLSNAQIIIPNGERLGNKVIEVEGLKKAMGDKLLVENLSFSLPPGGIVGVIGPNGAGKSTLFRMLTGQEKPDAGEITFGDTVQLSFVDQSRDALDANKTVWEEISGGAEQIDLGDAQMNSRAYCSAFNFKGGDQQKKVGMLSGGERNRVHLAKTLAFGQSGALPVEVLMRGLVVGASLMAGAFAAKPFVLRMKPEQFQVVMEALMLCAGLAMLGIHSLPGLMLMGVGVPVSSKAKAQTRP